MKLFHNGLLLRGLVGIRVGAGAGAVLVACGSGSSPPMITWNTPPDNGGAAERAHQCTDASGGAYRARIEVLPTNATMAEAANAGFLRPFSDADAAEPTAGMLPAPVATGRWKSMVAAAGADPHSPDFAWGKVIETASAGGQLASDSEAGRHAEPSMAGPAGGTAADIIGGLARSSAAPADMSVGQEGAYGFARYPRVFAEKPSTPPLGGTDLAVGAYSRYPDQALALVKCVNPPENATRYMLDEGAPLPYAASYDDPKVRESYLDADLIRRAVAEAGPCLITPAAADAFMSDVLRGKRLL
ncbi:hypothetical protein [Nocardia terpenica]|uniref:ABC transporter substrate-binding protein n=1 Tax=Nocardia terpenica TaxID=455432 RepID=A0A6G9Z7U8_9NOCA|nr:hypothetical protein [Nocardia terpenica]QIS21500.1 hypothetical protein F6W96_27355 [Nocardia terpenica]